MSDTSTSLVARMGERFGVEPNKVYNTFKRTIVRADASDEQVMMLMIVADQHGLNPFTKEIYAYPDKRGGVVPVVGLDGWVRIVQEHPQFDGWSFEWDAAEKAMTCTIWRKDRAHPTSVTEYLEECIRPTDAWRSMPRRMMRHSALMQCARVAFGFSGIHDEDEAEAIYEGQQQPAKPGRISEALARAKARDPIPMVEEVTEPPAQAEPTPLAHAMAELAAATDEDASAEVFMAWGPRLSPDEYAQLSDAHRARFTPKENQDGN